jgi:hypothetical protein
MLQSLAQRFTRGAMSAVLLSVVCSGVASAQVRRYGTPNLVPSTQRDRHRSTRPLRSKCSFRS